MTQAETIRAVRKDCPDDVCLVCLRLTPDQFAAVCLAVGQSGGASTEDVLVGAVERNRAAVAYLSRFTQPGCVTSTQQVANRAIELLTGEERKYV